jgi:CDP-paratose 2-epimerase
MSLERPVLITGGAGFIGSNLAHRLAQSGDRVLIYDNFSRPSVERNAHWLQTQYPQRIEIEKGDVRDRPAITRAVARARMVYHFAAQVAVTSSLQHPIEDFAINAQGTLHVLEAIRACSNPPPLVFTSTNKVYGSLPGLRLVERAACYEPEDPRVVADGIGESQSLDFHSPYGCSKGAADQYVLDYARSFGLPALVFRMSCIYGPRQFGTEDQGWVAHFVKEAIFDRILTIYGNGKQVRDLLYVDDLVRALILADQEMANLRGRAFNLGGGPENACSLLEILGEIGTLNGGAPRVSFEGWRVGDQRYYVSDTRSFGRATGWKPAVDPRAGLSHLYQWIKSEAAPHAFHQGEARL